LARRSEARRAVPRSDRKLSANQVAHLAADIILEKKGTDLVVVEISGCSDLADYMVIATGKNRRHVQTMAEEIDLRMKKAAVSRLGTSGLENGWWVLLDLGTVIVHLMQEEARRYYDLEALWADAPVIRRGIEA
jgi:ribosome-associated protein